MFNRSAGVFEKRWKHRLYYSHFSEVGQIGEDVRIDCRQLVVAQISEGTERRRGGMRDEKNKGTLIKTLQSGAHKSLL